MTEHWLPVVGWEGIYEVSDLGRVKSLERQIYYSRWDHYRTWREKILTPQRTSMSKNGVSGRLFVVLSKENQVKNAALGPLVLRSFVGEPKDGEICRHLNGDWQDCSLVNLRWGSQKENVADCVRHGHHHWASKTHCPQGHEYTAENTYSRPSRIERQCRICKRQKNKERYRRSKEFAW